ncbi:RecA-family ATPase [Bradyrhizobium sp. S3.9.2]|uniref:AAA family ATPase n=1 Tax=Bradyrhizobium sp. S3.9.2 TaxID=3156432 RepID=UPI00339986D2
MPTNSADDRFELTNYDLGQIANLQRAESLTFDKARNLYLFRNRRLTLSGLYLPEIRECEALEKQLARRNAEAAAPLRRSNDNDGYQAPPQQATRARATPPPTDPPPELLRLDLAKYDTEPIPEREWGVRDRFPRRTVALLSGEGAVGKSMLLLQLSVAHVLGRDWLRSMPEPGPVLLVNCEDEGDELVRRLEPILKNYHAKFSDVAADLHTFSLANQDPLLAVVDRSSGRIVPTPLYANLLERVKEVQPICTVIDNVADVYGGSEIDRSQVRQFVALMRQIAIASGGYVIMSSHPSLAGIASKTGLSGSTQWHNSVRARAFVHIAENGDQSGTRVLEFMKSNYSALSERVELQWSNGLYVPVRAPSAPEQAARNAAADALFLQLLDRFTAKGENVSPKQTANNYAPSVFAKMAEAKKAHFGRDHFADALDRLIAAVKIAVEPYGAASRSTIRIVRRGVQ